jgi:transposase
LLQPLRRRIWAPAGQTPIQPPSNRQARLRVICAVTGAPWARRFGMYYELLNHNCRAADFTRFLRRLHHHLPRTVLLIWDRLPAHRSAASQLACSGCFWLEPRWLPAYAPELDPVEYVWTRAKRGDLANWIPSDINALEDRLQHVLQEYRNNPNCLESFFQSASIPV